MRVVAVTSNTSLVVALGSMMRDWELVSVRDADQAAAEAGNASVILIDLGGTDAGLVVAEQLYRGGTMIPTVVLGDVLHADSQIPVLVRPFSLEELGAAVRSVTEKPARGSGQAAPAVAPQTPNGEPQAAPPPREREPEPQPARQPAPAADPAPAVPRAAEPAAAREEIREEDTVEEQAAGPSEGEAFEAEEVLPAPAFDPPPARAQPTPPQPAVATRQPEVRPEPGRWRRRRVAEVAAQEAQAEPPLVRRLRTAAAYAREIENLLDELPFLADLQTMADGLVEEITSALSCTVVSVSVRREGGFEVVGHRGLSRVEVSMVVPDTQPLFGDVLATGEGILIQPVDLAQGLVAGIGGARTEALMAAPAVVERECVAIVVAGGDRFSEGDLDRLSQVATEAAPGLAVALRLERLRSFPG
jgi:hypothetical protein